jgi:glucans biosynthesis protein
MLVEIPTRDETFDNLVAFWNPAAPVQAGQHLRFAYRLHWGEEPPARPTVAEVVATRIGVGGIPGQKQTVASRKFVIDFRGGKLAGLDRDSKVEPVISASRGEIRAVAARPFKEIGGWRCNFDLVAEGNQPVDLRCYLRDASGDALTETWLYQWSPT